MRFELVLLKLESLMVNPGGNVRIEYKDSTKTDEAWKITDLSMDIEAVGLKTPLTVWFRDKTPEIVAGHRRHRALLRLRERNQQRYKELFKDGVPCNVLRDATEQEAMIYLADHGNELPLGDRFEVQLTANKLMDAGITREGLANSLRGLLDRVVGPLTGDRLKKVKALEEERHAAAEAKNTSKVASLEKEIRKEIGEARAGYCQHLQDVWRNPPIVLQALRYRATMELPDGVDFLPILSNGQINTLAKALDEDVKLSPEYSRRLPGPNWKKRWESIVESQKSRKPTEKTVRAKSMASKDIDAMAKTMASAGMKQVLGRAADAGNSTDIRGVDEMLYYAELVAKHDPDLWKQVVKRAGEIEKKLNQAAATEAAPGNKAA